MSRPDITAAVNRITTINPIQQAFAALRRRSQRGSTGSGWRTVIGQVISDLEDLNHSTERDFLAVGEKLMEFRSTARQIASDMAALTELISGKQGRNASHALTGMLEHLKEMDRGIEQSGRALGEVRDLSSRVRLAFAGLRNTVSVFRTLCTLTRIETSRLGNTGGDFGDLAAEVRPLSESIQSSGDGVLEASYQLDHSVHSAIRSGSEVRVKQLKELPALIAGVLNSLKSFEERQQRAVESSNRQAAQYAAVCEAIDDLVRSIQFHDITRQQIEHVVVALRQLHSSVDKLPPDARAILTLQRAHLAEAARLFASSTDSLQRDLESIAARVHDMAEASKVLMGVSDDDQDSFFLQMEGQFTTILKMLNTCSTAQSQMESTAANLGETIGRMQTSVAEIRGIEIRIQRISTNATIRATHIGTAGIALNVIAEVIERQALDSNTKTEDAAGALAAMSDAAACVSGGSGVAVSASTHEVTEQMRRAVVELHSSSESSFSRVNQIATLGARLAGDISAVRSGFRAGQLVADVVQRAGGELERIGAQAAQASLEVVGGTPNEHLENLAKHYTMQRERDVHQSVAQGALIASTPTETSKAPIGDGDLGDNVELF